MRKFIALIAAICTYLSIVHTQLPEPSLENTTWISNSGDVTISFSHDASVVTVSGLPCIIKYADGDYHQFTWLQGGDIQIDVLPHISYYVYDHELIEQLDYENHVTENRYSLIR